MADKEPELKLDDAPLAPVDVEVEIAAPETEVKVETPKSGGEEDDVEAAVTALKEQLAGEQAARLEATNRANDEAARRTKAEGELKTSRSAAHENQYNLVVGQIESLNDKAAGLERDLADAHAQGDYAKVAKTQREMARAEAQIQRLEDGKADLEARKTDGSSDDAVPARANDADPVDKFISELRVSDRDKSWLRTHRDVVTDQGKFNKLAAAANYAVASKGLAPDSDAFYAFIEQDLGIGAKAAPEPVQVREAPAPVTPRKAPAFAAPVSREATSMNGTQKKTGKIRLSPLQQEAAQIAGMTPGEYAKQLVKQVEEGQLDARLIQYVN